MNNNSNTKIMKLIIIVVVLIILILGALIVVLTTDLFKSDKILFAKYAMEIYGDKDSFISSDIINYYSKVTKTPLENSTNLSIQMGDSDKFALAEEEKELLNQFNVVANGKVDGNNECYEENISINYSPDVVFPINIRYKDKLFGYQTDYVGSKYLVDDRYVSYDNNEEQLFDIEYIKNIIPKYATEIFNQFPEERFSKEKNGNTTIYKMTITTTDVKNAIETIIETLSKDDETLEKFNIDKEQIENAANSSEESETYTINKEYSIDILLYKNKGKITKIGIVSEGIEMISIEKVLENENLQYNVTLDDGNEDNIEMTLTYAGLNSLQNIEENYVLKINNKENDVKTNIITYYLNNKVNFVDNVDIQSFDDNNAVIYSSYNEEQLNNFTQALEERQKQVSIMQNEKLGFGTMETSTMEIYMYSLSPFTIYRSSRTLLDDDELDELEKNSFNSQFEMFESNSANASNVNALLETVLNSSEYNTSDGKIEEIYYNNMKFEVNSQNIEGIIGLLSEDKKYSVEVEEEQQTGYVYKIIINEEG